jgi:hypothetical protein
LTKNNKIKLKKPRPLCSEYDKPLGELNNEK